MLLKTRTIIFTLPQHLRKCYFTSTELQFMMSTDLICRLQLNENVFSPDLELFNGIMFRVYFRLVKKWL